MQSAVLQLNLCSHFIPDSLLLFLFLFLIIPYP